MKSFKIWRGRLKHEGKDIKNLSLKILSVVFAVVLWTIIVNIYDPTTSYTFSNVSVSLLTQKVLQIKIIVMRLLMVVKYLYMSAVLRAL